MALWNSPISKNCQNSSLLSLLYPFPFFARKSKKTKKKDTFYTKTRLTRYLRNLISQSCTNKSQKWLHEIIQFLKIFKILAVSLCQRWQKRIRFKAIWHEFSNPQFSHPRPPYGRPRERTQYFSGGAAPKNGHFFHFGISDTWSNPHNFKDHFAKKKKREEKKKLTPNLTKLPGIFHHFSADFLIFPQTSSFFLRYPNPKVQKLSGAIQKLSGTIQSYPELSKAIRSYPKSMDSYGKLSGAIQSYPELSKAIRNYPKSMDSYGKTIQDSQELSGTIQSYPELSKAIQSYLRLSDGPKPNRFLRFLGSVSSLFLTKQARPGLSYT